MTTTDTPVVGGVVTRTVDQGLWSLGFFAFNLAAGLTLPVEQFASLSVATAVGFIAVGASRAWGIYAPVVGAATIGVSPETSIDRGSSWRGTGLFAAISSVVAFGWVGRNGNVGFALVVAALAGTMVVADLPRQVLVIRGHYLRAAMLSGIHAVGALATASLVAVGVHALLPAWLVTLAVVLVVGLALCGRETAEVRAPTQFSISWRITAEAFYLGVGSQIAILLLYAVDDDVATAGLRFAYMLVFAPAFVVIQGVQPLIFKHLATSSAHGTRAVLALSIRWNLLIAAGLGVCGLVGYAVLTTILTETGPSVAIPYVLPVGVAILAAQTFEVALMATRFFVTPALVHRVRLGSVLIDVGTQAAGVYLAGAEGLVWVLVVGGLVRIVVSVGALAVLPRRDRVAAS